MHALPWIWAAFVVVGLGRNRPRRAARRVAPAAVVRRPRRLAFRQAVRQRASVEAGIADLIDLFAVAVGSGLNVRLAVEAVARRAPPGRLAEELQAVGRDAAVGRRLADRLEEAPVRLGVDALRPLVAALVDAERYGSALGPSLDRLADEARRSRVRRAEEAARRIPVKLLFPLVTCVLPAFGLLTVAPLIAGGLRAVRLSP